MTDRERAVDAIQAARAVLETPVYLNIFLKCDPEVRQHFTADNPPFIQVRIKDVLAMAVKEMTDVVWKAQNGPPQGEADGSLDEKAWTRLRDTSLTLERAMDVLVPGWDQNE